MKLTSGIFLALSYGLLLLLLLHYAGSVTFSIEVVWSAIVCGLVVSTISWLLYIRAARKQIDPFNLPESEHTEKPQVTTYIVCFSLYLLVVFLNLFQLLIKWSSQ